MNLIFEIVIQIQNIENFMKHFEIFKMKIYEILKNFMYSIINIIM